MTRWSVVDTRVWEITALNEAAAAAFVEDTPDGAPLYRAITAEPLEPPAAEPARRRL